jgi:hypothetical protein
VAIYVTLILGTVGDKSNRKARKHPNWGNSMSRAAKFKRADVTRFTRAVLDAGLVIARVAVDTNGVIFAVPGKPEGLSSEPNPWDEVLDADQERAS